MSSHVKRDNHPIDKNTRNLISTRYKRITKAINFEFWNSNSEIAHSRYVGSYGRGTAVSTSDLDVLMEFPNNEYDHFTSLTGNGQSRLLQAVKDSILETYPTTDVKGDGQVVIVKFSDGMKFEILPAFKKLDWFGNWDGTYKYPDTHMGGNWMTTNPKAEQDAMDEKDTYDYSNGLLKDTCKHIRYIRAESFKSYHLSGILIDSFVYRAIGNWHWLRDGEGQGSSNDMCFEEVLLDCYNTYYPYASLITPKLSAPGSGMEVSGDDWDVLGKVLNKMV